MPYQNCPFLPRLVLMLAVALGSAPREASAEDAHGEAERLIRHGLELRRAHDDDGAEKEFHKAYDLVRTPRAAGQLGLAEQALGRWEDAHNHLGEAIRTGNDPWVAKNREVLDDAMTTIQGHLGRVEVIGDPEGAEVSVNGRPAGKLPLAEPVRVSAGQVDIDVHAPGYTRVLRTVTIVGGQYQRIVIHLATESAWVPQLSAAPNPQPTLPVEPLTSSSPSPSSPPSPPESAPSSVRPVLKWMAAGVAGAALGTGVVFTVLHSQNSTSFDKEGCFNRDGTGVDRTGQPTASCRSLLDTMKTDQVGAIVGYVAAGGFALTWLVLHLMEPSRSSSADHASRLPVCLPSAVGLEVSCAVHF